jgi:spore maturation protein CgeB
MRIGIVGPTWPDCFADNILDTLRTMGHQAVSVGSSYSLGGPYSSAVTGLVRNAVPALDQRLQRHIVRSALGAECEIVIVTEQRLAPDTVRQLRRGGAKVALWFPDALANLGRQLMLISPYDAVFVKEPHVVKRLGAVLDVPLF